MPDLFRTIAISGAGSGLGEAMACRFAREGYSVAVTDIDKARAEQALGRIESRGGSGFAMALDVTRIDDWERLYRRVKTEWGGLGVLVNNAGVAAAGRLEDSSLEDWQWVVDIDLMGVVRGCHRFLPMLREQGSGHIVNVSSMAGMMPVPELSAYATAKAGVVALSEQLLIDLDGSGVGVSVLCPAYVNTRLLESFRSRNANHHKAAKKWMEGSRISSEDVADHVFNAVERRRFLVLTHPETRWAWRFRRWFPRRFNRTLIRASKRLSAKYAS